MKQTTRQSNTTHPRTCTCLRQLIFSRKSDCFGCAVLLCLVCLFDLLASFFLPSHLSFKNIYVIVYSDFRKSFLVKMIAQNSGCSYSQKRLRMWRSWRESRAMTVSAPTTTTSLTGRSGPSWPCSTAAPKGRRATFRDVPTPRQISCWPRGRSPPGSTW